MIELRRNEFKRLFVAILKKKASNDSLNGFEALHENFWTDNSKSKSMLKINLLDLIVVRAQFKSSDCLALSSETADVLANLIGFSDYPSFSKSTEEIAGVLYKIQEMN